MMGLGMMIGAGVFVGMGICMGLVGPGGLVLTFALNGLIALFTAMSFAELSSAIPRAGGAYNFARIAFGRGTSFLGGWMEWFAGSLAGAFYAVVFASFTVMYLNQLLAWDLAEVHIFMAIRAVAVCAACLFLYVNYRGSSETGKLGAICAAAQMLFVIAIAVIGVVVAILQPERIANFRPFMPMGWWKLLGSMGVIYVAFEGFEVIAQAGDETIDPKRNVPKAMLYSVAIVTVTYVLVAFATVVAISPGAAELGGGKAWELIGGGAGIEGFRTAMRHLMPAGTLLVTLAVIFSSTSALNATIYSATRASFALGRDRMFPASFSKIGSKRRTPYVALLATGVIILSMSVWMRPKDLSAAASIMFLLLFFLVNLCVIKVRRNMGDELEYGYIMPLFPLFPILAIVFQAALCGGIFQESAVAWIIAGVWAPAGVAVYLLYSRRRAVPTPDEIHVFEEAHAPEGDEYRVMVPVANPDNALELVRNTYRLCAAKNARVELLHMVEVPDQVPLADAHRYMMRGKEGILETMLYLAPQFPLTTMLRYCRNVARGIVSAVRQKKINMLILGWQGRARTPLFNLGSIVSPIIERVPCDVVMLKGCGGNRKFRRVLVPVAGGPNGVLALEVATILADRDEGEVVAFTVDGRRTPFDIGAFVRQNQARLHLPLHRVATKSVKADNVVDAILREAEDYDMVVAGCTHEPLLRRITHERIPETIAKRCRKPFVMVKAAGGLRSWIKRWI